MKAEKTQQRILAAAIKVAKRDGWIAMRRDDVATEADCATGLIHRYYGTMYQLRNVVMRHAVKEGVTSIVAEGLTVGDPTARQAPANVKKAAAQALVR